MNLMQSIILGILQGVTEFLPVSSSGHLVILRHFMELNDIPLLFDVLLHAATLLVIVFYFRRRVGLLVMGILRFIGGNRERETLSQARLAGIILLGTICTGVLGLITLSLDIHHNNRLVYALFMVTGLILAAGRLIPERKGVSHTGIKQGLVIGIAQGIGTLPGISRSGITITAAIAGGVSREKAGELSFLFFIPAVLGALLVEILTTETITGTITLPVLMSGIAAAVITGFVSLALLMRIISGGKLHFFSLYLIPLGLVGLLFL